MGQLDEALQRLDGAVARLESAVRTGATGGDPDLAGLADERDRLAEEVRRLRARASEDARLRAEAAAAVREALHDLRGAIGHSGEVHGNA